MFYGETSLGGTSTPTDSSSFEVGSLSKSFTGILLAGTLNDEPQISIDDPLAKFIPELSGTFMGDSFLDTPEASA
jgi:CubicO group peptidase (beta-lactamase class C family)